MLDAPENGNSDHFPEEKRLKMQKIVFFAKFPGIPVGIWRKPNSREFTKGNSQWPSCVRGRGSNISLLLQMRTDSRFLVKICKLKQTQEF